MRSVILVGAIGAAYYAYTTGRFDDLLSAAKGLPDAPYTPQIPNILEVIPDEKGKVHPLEIASREELILRTNWADVQPWARKNILWVSAMMWQESRGKSDAVSSKGASGVLQVMPTTMQDLHDRLGFKKYPPTPSTLHIDNIGVYFGTAYLQHLSQKSSDQEWITRAYNAGPGGERSNGTWPRETVDYLAKIKARYALLQSKGVN